MTATEPEQGEFDYMPCDTIKNFTLQYDMGFRGHNLCWGDYNPTWLVNLSDEDKRAALVNHIQNVMSHYGSDVVAWDVVNEAISDESSGIKWFYKDSDWYPSVPVNIYMILHYSLHCDCLSLAIKKTTQTQANLWQCRILYLLLSLLRVRHAVHVSYFTTITISPPQAVG